jgi:tetratricopeptide (TPR) repeat protein
MLSLRIKQCERALRSGRLDEAYALLRQPDVRSHRRGQELLDKLVRAFIDRGRTHLAAGRLTEAADDADKAVHLAGNIEMVAQFQAAVEHALNQEQETNRRCGQALAIARRQMDRGELSVVQRMLETAPPPPDYRIDGLAAGDWEAAIDHLSPLPAGASQNGQLRILCGQISRDVAQRIRESIQSGRLDTGAALLAKLRRLPIETTDTQEMTSLLQQCRSAHDAIESARWRDAEEILSRLQTLLPETKWAAEAAAQIRQLGQQLSVLRSGPLSLMASASAPAMPIESPNLDDFCLHVDGAGSFKVIGRPSITLGPISTSRKIDVPLAIDSTSPAITISRSDDDYFLRAGAPVTVNGTPTTSRLLSSGDKISIGSRSRITFLRPSPASSTAVLDLCDARPAAANLRSVVLMNREIVIGPGAADHIRAQDLPEKAILHRRGPGLALRFGQKTFDLTPDAPVNLGPVHLVISREQRQ